MSATGLQRPTREPIMTLKGVSKSFGPVRALEDVGFDVYPRSIHGLVGENGAGKSTLVKIITGLEQADEGEVILSGERVRFRTPIEARAHGVAAVYQDPKLFPAPFGRREHRHGRLSRGPARHGGPPPDDRKRARAPRPSRLRPRSSPHCGRPLGRRASVRRDRPRPVLRLARLDPRRTDLGLDPDRGRTAVRRHAGAERARHGGYFHHPSAGRDRSAVGRDHRPARPPPRRHAARGRRSTGRSSCN